MHRLSYCCGVERTSYLYVQYFRILDEGRGVQSGQHKDHVLAAQERLTAAQQKRNEALKHVSTAHVELLDLLAAAHIPQPADPAQDFVFSAEAIRALQQLIDSVESTCLNTVAAAATDRPEMSCESLSARRRQSQAVAPKCVAGP